MTAIDFAAFVDELATVSGDAILPFFRTSLGVEDKGSAVGFDPVTQADRAAENAMRGLIKRNFPEHGIVGEEYGNERADAEYVWVLDPIDGTKSFISGMGLADRAHPQRHAGVRHDAPAVHPRALLRRRRRGALSRACW
jgi:myo-inositol-1(or 4)-monophosphatase